VSARIVGRREARVVGQGALQRERLIARHDTVVGLTPVGVLLQHALHGREVARLGQQLQADRRLPLPLGAPILVPGLDLRVAQAEARRQLHAVLHTQVLLPLEALLQRVQLPVRERGPRLVRERGPRLPRLLRPLRLATTLRVLLPLLLLLLLLAIRLAPIPPPLTTTTTTTLHVRVRHTLRVSVRPAHRLMSTVSQRWVVAMIMRVLK